MAKKVGSDIEVARAANLQPIEVIADWVGIPKADLLRFGPYKAKVDFRYIEEVQSRATVDNDGWSR